MPATSAGSTNEMSDQESQQPEVPPGWAPVQPPAWGAPPGSPYAGWQSPQAPPGAAPPAYGQPGYGQPAYGQPAPTYGPAAPQPYPSYGPGWVPQTAFAPKPGIIALRPLGVGELLDGAISSIRANPRVVLGLSASVALVSSLVLFAFLSVSLTAFQESLSLDTETTGLEGETTGFDPLTAGSLVSWVVTLVFQVVLTGLLTVVISRQVLGEPVSIRQAWDRVRGQLPRLFGLTICYTIAWLLALAVPIVVGAVVLAAVGGAVGGIALVIGIVAAIPLAVWTYVTFALSGPALILERVSVVKAFGRSRRLVRGSWWRTLGILLLAALLVQVIGSILSLPFSIGGILFGGLGDSNTSFLAAAALLALGNLVSLALTLPFSAAIIVLLYVDQRMRREGLDLELQRASGQHPSTAGAPANPSPPAYPTAGQQPPQAW